MGNKGLDWITPVVIIDIYFIETFALITVIWLKI
jgi:hypothetical protein